MKVRILNTIETSQLNSYKMDMSKHIGICDDEEYEKSYIDDTIRVEFTNKDKLPKWWIREATSKKCWSYDPYFYYARKSDIEIVK